MPLSFPAMRSAAAAAAATRDKERGGAGIRRSHHAWLDFFSKEKVEREIVTVAQVYLVQLSPGSLHAGVGGLLFHLSRCQED